MSLNLCTGTCNNTFKVFVFHACGGQSVSAAGSCALVSSSPHISALWSFLWKIFRDTAAESNVLKTLNREKKGQNHKLLRQIVILSYVTRSTGPTHESLPPQGFDMFFFYICLWLKLRIDSSSYSVPKYSRRFGVRNPLPPSLQHVLLHQILPLACD